MSEITATAYEHFAPYVRGKLAELGVRDADLPDLCHEVFMVVHDKQEVVPEVDRVDLWLRAICRRVAAGYRRRCGNKLEILGRDVDLESAGVDSDASDIASGSERREQLALVRRALNRLDDESRDLLALHDVGEMPLTELAVLVSHDRKTVRKRLVSARRRVSRLICQDAPANDGGRVTPPESPLLRLQAEKGRARGLTADELEILLESNERTLGVIGNVAIADWRSATPEALDTVFTVAPQALERCGGDIVYLALVEPTLEPPSLAARQRLVDAFEMVGPYVSAFATVLLGGSSSISEAIINGMMLLVRARFPVRFFSGIAPAATWLSDSFARGARGPMTATTLTAAAECLRARRPATS